VARFASALDDALVVVHPDGPAHEEAAVHHDGRDGVDPQLDGLVVVTEHVTLRLLAVLREGLVERGGVEPGSCRDVDEHRTVRHRAVLGEVGVEQGVVVAGGRLVAEPPGDLRRDGGRDAV
jgi:hypothetical protein